MIERKCLYDGTSFTPKKSTQLYANSENRRRHLIQRQRADRERRKAVEYPLLKNLRIIEKLLKDKDNVRVHEDALVVLEYDFGIVSSVIKRGDKTIAIIYDYSIEQDDSNHLNYVIKRIKP